MVSWIVSSIAICALASVGFSFPVIEEHQEIAIPETVVGHEEIVGHKVGLSQETHELEPKHATSYQSFHLEGKNAVPVIKTVHPPTFPKHFSSVGESFGHKVSGHEITTHGISGHEISTHGISDHGITGHEISTHGITGHEISTHGISTHGISGHEISTHGISGHEISTHGISGHELSGHELSGQAITGHEISTHGITGHELSGHGLGHEISEVQPIDLKLH